MLRELDEKDYPTLAKLHKAREYDFALPEFSNPLYIVKAISEKDNEIIAAGLVKITSEAIIIFNESAKLKDKIESLEDLLTIGAKKTLDYGIPDWHCWVKDTGFANLLRRKYNFTNAGGKSLYLRLTNV